ncbi:MAG: hypothetical protein PHQ74_00775 [Crocinitomicaceae bacterium]|nr:hypothetical protein [Crocinitomicaceae bacterium]
MKTERQNWPEWATPNDESLIQLAETLMPHIKILSPDVVKLIVAENNNKLTQWTNDFKEIGIRADIYLWQDSPITFPGIRRHAGNLEISAVKKNRNNAKGNDSILLDDNSFPKELWSFILRGRKADKNGPANYSLAHIIDHKDYRSRHIEEIKDFEKTKEKNLYAGLHTSCANTVWLPNNLMKPTDHKGNIRQLLIQVVNKYYSPICTILPHEKSLNLDNIEDKWQIDRFPEPTIVGSIDKAEKFIEYRNNLIEERIKKIKLQ